METTLESEGMEGSPVDVAKVGEAEAVSWLDEKKDKADGSVMDAVVRVVESTDDVDNMDGSVVDAADDSVDGDDVSVRESRMQSKD